MLERFEGYKSGLKKGGIEYDGRLVVHTDGILEEEGYKGMKELLPSKPDAVYAQSDYLAIGVIKAVKEAAKKERLTKER